jgi:hypothetical protein
MHCVLFTALTIGEFIIRLFYERGTENLTTVIMNCLSTLARDCGTPPNIAIKVAVILENSKSSLFEFQLRNNTCITQCSAFETPAITYLCMQFFT